MVFDQNSTVDALVDFTEKMRSHGNKSIISFFFDLKKAFDTIEHNILLQKLESYGIRGNAHKWFRSYLNETIQRVEIKGISSKWSTIKCGVPQGSILGPLLFLIYINDQPHACNSTEIVLFADDTNVTAIGQINLRVEEDIIKLNYWLNANKLIINMDKTVEMNLKTSNSMTFQLNNCNIKKETVIKYLGVYIDSKLSFVSHIDNVKMRLAKQSGIISKLRYYAPRHQLLEFYRSNIRTTIQYGILVYGCCSYSSLLPIFMLQKKILKLMFFRNRRDHSEDIFIKHQILTVHELHVYELLKFVLRSINKLHSESFLNNLFEFENPLRGTRRGKLNMLKETFRKRLFEKHSLAYRGSRLYNILRTRGLLLNDIENANIEKVKCYYHEFKNGYLLNNNELTSLVFNYEYLG